MEEPLAPPVIIHALDSRFSLNPSPDDILMNQLQSSLEEDERIYRAEIDKLNVEAVTPPQPGSLHEIHLAYVTSMKHKVHSAQELFEIANCSRREALLLYVISSRHKVIQRRQRISLATMLASKKSSK